MELVIEIPDNEEALALFGSGDRNLKALKKDLGVGVVARNGIIKLKGEEAAVRLAAAVIEKMRIEVQLGRAVTPETIRRHQTGEALVPGEHGITKVESVSLRTKGQKRYLDAIQTHDITFCSGPAGTGKTFLAVAAAVSSLRLGKVKRIVLVRPAIEAGEKLGFLPGDFEQKITPYLRPLYDSLYDLMDYDQVKRAIEREVIEIVPLAYMRGRTLNRAFIILDEGQNTTREQMKMFLTRMGEGSKIVVTGDTSQVDLPAGKKSGMVAVQRILRNVEDIAFVVMRRADIVRHPLVSDIVRAYEEKGK